MKKTIILFLVLSLIVCLIPAFAVVSSAESVNSYTYKVPINANVKVYFTDQEIFVPTGSGEFKIYVNRNTSFAISYKDDIKNLIPEFMFTPGIKPVNISFGMDIDVTWDAGFANPNTHLIDPSFEFIGNYSNISYGGKTITDVIPYKIQYIQDGISYNSVYGSIYNRPYSFKFDTSVNVDYSGFTDTDFSLWLSAFRYSSVAGDDVNGSGYGLEFTIQDFYITFDYIDNREQVFQDNIQHNPGLGQSGMSWDDYFTNNPLPSFNVDLSGFAPVFSIGTAAVSDLIDITAPFRVSYDISIAGVRFDPIDIYLKIVTAVALLYTLIDVIRGVRRLT